MPAPKKLIISFRLPPDLMKTMKAKAARQHISRNKLCELILRDHFAKPDRHLSELINAEDRSDANQIDLFA
jgi:hypothetical protein